MMARRARPPNMETAMIVPSGVLDVVEREGETEIVGEEVEVDTLVVMGCVGSGGWLGKMVSVALAFETDNFTKSTSSRLGIDIANHVTDKVFTCVSSKPT